MDIQEQAQETRSLVALAVVAGKHTEELKRLLQTYNQAVEIVITKDRVTINQTKQIFQ